MPTITYRPGKDKSNRAAFVCGKAAVPAAMVTRILREIKGKPETAVLRIFIAKLSTRYGAFLEAMEKSGVSYQQAIQEMGEQTPRRSEGKPRITKEASAVAKALCRKYSEKSPEEMFTSFCETVARPEFKTLVVEMIDKNLSANGRNNQGKIRVRAERKGAVQKGLVERAEKARSARKAKK